MLQYYISSYIPHSSPAIVLKRTIIYCIKTNYHLLIAAAIGCTCRIEMMDRDEREWFITIGQITSPPNSSTTLITPLWSSNCDQDCGLETASVSTIVMDMIGERSYIMWGNDGVCKWAQKYIATETHLRTRSIDSGGDCDGLNRGVTTFSIDMGGLRVHLVAPPIVRRGQSMVPWRGRDMLLPTAMMRWLIVFSVWWLRERDEFLRRNYVCRVWMTSEGWREASYLLSERKTLVCKFRNWF